MTEQQFNMLPLREKILALHHAGHIIGVKVKVGVSNTYLYSLGRLFVTYAYNLRGTNSVVKVISADEALLFNDIRITGI